MDAVAAGHQARKGGDAARRRLGRREGRRFRAVVETATVTVASGITAPLGSATVTTRLARAAAVCASPSVGRPPIVNKTVRTIRDQR